MTTSDGVTKAVLEEIKRRVPSRHVITTADWHKSYKIVRYFAKIDTERWMREHITIEDRG